jgi:hypothetical protein
MPIAFSTIQNTSKERADFLTMDIETSDGLRGEILKLGCLFIPDNEPKKRYRIFYSIEEYFLILKSLIPSKTQRRKRGSYKNIFIHNLTFDIRFVLAYAIRQDNVEIQHIASGSKDLVVDIIFREENFHFRHIDSFQFTLCSQEVFERAMLPKVIKRTDIKVGEDLNLTEADYIERVKSDVEGLYLSLRRYFLGIFELFHIKINGRRLTSLSSLALRIFRANFLVDGLYNPYVSKRKNEENRLEYYISAMGPLNTILASYFGGRTELFRRKVAYDGSSYDINSLYPYTFDMPYPTNAVHNPIRPVEVTSDEKLQYYLDEYEGFIDARRKGYVHEHNSNIPILPTRDKNFRTCFFTGIKKGVFVFPEIRYARDLYRVDIEYPIDVYLFHRGDFFNDYGKKLYDWRLQFKAENSPIQLPIKILLNSLYGKFGQKYLQRSIKFLSLGEVKEFDLGRPIESFLRNQSEVLEIREMQDIVVIYYMNMAPRMFMLPHISSTTTSYGRIELHKGLEANQDSLLYCDTDSMWLEDKPKGIDLSDTRLGAWKQEHTFSEAAFLALKFYAYEEDSTLKVRIKGVSKFMINDAKFTSAQDFFARSISHNFVERARYNTIRKSIREHQGFLSASERTKQLTGIYTKREVTPDGQTRPINIGELIKHEKI